MKKIPIYLILTGSLLVASSMVQAQNYKDYNNPNYNNSKNISAPTYNSYKKETYESPRGWDGVHKPNYIPKGDNPKWYDNAAPTNSRYGNDHEYRKHHKNHYWKKHNK